MRYLLLAIGLLSLTTGCVHTHLRASALNSASIIPDLQQQQVMNNIARFCHNPDALPYFAVAGVGTVQVGQNAGATVNLIWNPFTLVTEALNLNGTRSIVEQYSVAVTVSPDQLSVMRSAYQWVLGIRTEDVRARLEAFYGEGFDEELIPSDPWFSCGCNHPPECACCVGEYCGTYSWVSPENQDELTRFTLAILDIATAGPVPPRPMRDVKVTYDGVEGEAKLSKTEITVREPMQHQSGAAGPRGRDVPIEGLPGTTPAAERPATERPERTRQNFFNPNAGIQFSPSTQ